METYPLTLEMGTALSNYFVVTGHQGKKLREVLIDRLLSYPEDTCLYLDFSLVDLIDFTGADELLAITQARLKSREIPNRYICLINLKDQHKANIHQALKAKNLAIVYLDERKTPKVLGDLNTYLTRTFDYISRKKTTLTRDMAKDMGIPLNTAATRLLNLFHEQLVLRRVDGSPTGGKQFIYTSF